MKAGPVFPQLRKSRMCHGNYAWCHNPHLCSRIVRASRSELVGPRVYCLTEHSPKSNREGGVLLAIKEIGLHRSFPFDVNRPAELEAKRIAQCFARRG